MTDKQEKPYRTVRVSAHERINYPREERHEDVTDYVTSYIRHEVQDDGSVKTSTIGDQPPVMDFMVALANTLSSTLKENFDGPVALKVAASIASEFVSDIARYVGTPMAAMVINGSGPLPGKPSGDENLQDLLGEDSDLTEEQKAALQLSMQSVKLNKNTGGN